jgi:hypothetical protein
MKSTAIKIAVAAAPFAAALAFAADALARSSWS